MSVISDLIEKIIGRSEALYHAVSGAARPDGVDGDTLVEPDTGNRFKWYSGRWHLKEVGTYTDITLDVTFVKGNLASAVNPETLEVTYDKAYGDLATTTPNTGYELEGWYLDADLTEEVDKDTIVTVEEAHNLYAKHVPIEYGITYNLDGGTNGANPATYNIEDTPVALADATKDGFTFRGWFSDADLTTEVTEIALGSTGDVTLYAKWEVVGG